MPAEERDGRLVVAHLRLQAGAVAVGARTAGSRRSDRTGPSTSSSRSPQHEARRGRRRRAARRCAARRRAPRRRCRSRRRAARGRSCASATATQPLPVQTSAIVSGASRSRKQLERGFDDQLGFGPRNEHGGRDLERQPPELAAAGDVGERLARGAAGDERVVLAREAGRRRLAAPSARNCVGVPAEQRAAASSRASRSASAAEMPASRSRCARVGDDARESCSRDRRRVLQLLGLVVRDDVVEQLARSPFSTSVSRCVVKLMR